MKTKTYILHRNPDCVPGDAGPRDRELPKVVDLAAWRAEHPAEPEAGLPETAAGREPVRRRWTALDWAELTATLAAAAAFVALTVRVLLF